MNQLLNGVIFYPLTTCFSSTVIVVKQGKYIYVMPITVPAQVLCAYNSSMYSTVSCYLTFVTSGFIEQIPGAVTAYSFPVKK